MVNFQPGQRLKQVRLPPWLRKKPNGNDLFEPVEMKKNANPQVQFQQILVASPWLSPVQGLVFEDQGVLPHIFNSRPRCCFLQYINIVNWNSSDIQISNNTLSVSWNLCKVRSSAFSSSICSDMSSNRWAHLQKSQKKCLWRELKPYKTMKKNVNNCPCYKHFMPFSKSFFCQIVGKAHNHRATHRWRFHHTLAFLPTADPQAPMLSSAPPCWEWQVGKAHDFFDHLYDVCRTCIDHIYIQYIHHNVETYSTSVILMLVLRISTVSSYVYNVDKRGWPHWLSTDLRIRATEEK